MSSAVGSALNQSFIVAGGKAIFSGVLAGGNAIISAAKIILWSLPSNQVDRVVVRTVRWGVGMHLGVSAFACIWFMLEAERSRIFQYKTMCYKNSAKVLKVWHPLRGAELFTFFARHFSRPTPSLNDLLSDDSNIMSLREIERMIQKDPKILKMGDPAPIVNAILKGSAKDDFPALKLMLRHKTCRRYTINPAKYTHEGKTLLELVVEKVPKRVRVDSPSYAVKKVEKRLQQNKQNKKYYFAD